MRRRHRRWSQWSSLMDQYATLCAPIFAAVRLHQITDAEERRLVWEAFIIVYGGRGG